MGRVTVGLMVTLENKVLADAADRPQCERELNSSTQSLYIASVVSVSNLLALSLGSSHQIVIHMCTKSLL